MKHIIRAMLAALLIFAASNVGASETLISATIKAQHLDGGTWERWNPGGVIAVRSAPLRDGSTQAEAGFGLIRDSIGNWSPVYMVGLSWEVTPSIRINARAVAFRRQYNLAGEVVGWKVGPLPSVEWWATDRFGFEAIYLPRPTPNPRDSSSILIAAKWRFGSAQ